MFNHCDFSAPIPTKPTPDARQEEPVPVNVYITYTGVTVVSLFGLRCGVIDLPAQLSHSEFAEVLKSRLLKAAAEYGTGRAPADPPLCEHRPFGLWAGMRRVFVLGVPLGVSALPSILENEEALRRRAELFILSSIAGETCAIEAAKRLRGVEA